VLAHGRPAVLVVTMTEYATQPKVDSGQRDVETPENTTMVTWCPAETMLTEGVTA